MKKAEEYIQKIVDNKIPKHLQIMYIQVIDAMKAGFYEGIKYQKKCNQKSIKNEVKTSNLTEPGVI